MKNLLFWMNLWAKKKKTQRIIHGRNYNFTGKRKKNFFNAYYNFYSWKDSNSNLPFWRESSSKAGAARTKMKNFVWKKKKKLGSMNGWRYSRIFTGEILSRLSFVPTFESNKFPLTWPRLWTWEQSVRTCGLTIRLFNQLRFCP